MQPAIKDEELLWEGLAPIQADNSGWQDQTIQLFGYSPEMITRYGVTGMLRVQTSNQAQQFRDYLFTNTNEAVFENTERQRKDNWREQIWEIKNLYDAQNERYITMHFKQGDYIRGRVNHSFTSALPYAGAIHYLPNPMGELLWTGSVALIFDVSHDNRGWGVRTHPHHQVITRFVEISKVTEKRDIRNLPWVHDPYDRYALIRWARHSTSSSSFNPAIFTQLRATYMI